MAKTVGIGIQNFEKLITNQCFYIDKTEFIKEWWESKDEVTLITRPRRFGKTLNMSMLESFFSIKYADRGDLFEKFSIWKYKEYQQIQGTYPVISISFASIKETTYENTKLRIYQIVRNLYSEYEFLLESDALSISDKDFMKRILTDISETDATFSLHQLSKFLYQYYGKKVIILLDEYDTPMQEAYVNRFWEELAVFTRSMFNSAFKTNPYLERAVMTGITRVSKESTFSDLNNLKVVTTTSNEYETAFGFTEKEVFDALEECGYGEEKEKVKHWYDGFIFGNQKDIYNPWSILNFLVQGIYDTYWANTSENRLVNKLLREGNKRIKQSFESLLKGQSIICPIDEQIVYNRLRDNETAVWSLLLASGYLKVLNYEQIQDMNSEKRPRYELTLTNREVKSMFYHMVQDWFSEAGADYNDFVDAMLRGDIEEMNAYMNRVTKDVFSYFDTGKEPSESEPERFYHGFVLGLITELSGEYVLTSNRESGFGRYDVMIEPKDKKKDAMILEFKVHNPKKEHSLEETVETALKQIEQKQYESILLAKGFLKDQICKYGFAFEGKQVLIGKNGTVVNI